MNAHNPFRGALMAALAAALAAVLSGAGPFAVSGALAQEAPSGKRAAMEKRRQAMFQAMVDAGQAKPDARDAVVAHYFARSEDLNADGRPEYLMTGPCGPICVCRIFSENEDGSMRILLTAPCMPEGLTVLEKSGGEGYAEIMSPIASYASGGIKLFYAVKDGSYREIRKECFGFKSVDDPVLVRRPCP